MKGKSLLAGAALAAILAGVTAVPPASGAEAPARRGFLTMAELKDVYGSTFDLPAPPAGQTPEQRADWIFNQRPALGRTPADWTKFANETLSLDLPASVPPLVRTNLVAGVARIYRAAGLDFTPEVEKAVRADAAALPAGIRTAFADLVGTVAGAYELQMPIANIVLARVETGVNPHVPLLQPTERDIMAASQLRLVEAINNFRARTSGLFGPADGGGPLFSDPEGLVVLGGTGDDTYTRAGVLPDPVLLVEPSGNDTYLNSAGGACPVTPEDPVFQSVGRWLKCNGLVLSVVADIGDGIQAPSNDRYTYDGEPAAVQGAGGPGALGLLVDVGGNDDYLSTMTRSDNGPFFQYFDGGAQGFGFAGVGIQLDGTGDDDFSHNVVSTRGRDIWGFGQGFGGSGGLGISSDSMGEDRWLSSALGLRGGGFQGIYTDGVGLWFGVGIMVDAGLGDDIYDGRAQAVTVDYYAQGFGGLGGVGIMYEDGGNDDYFTSETGSAPFINPILNCAYGTGSFGGVGILADLGGNDRYYGESIVTSADLGAGASVMDSGFGGPGIAYGLFMDIGGNDHYEMYAQAPGADIIHGRGLWEPGIGDPVESPLGHNTWGTFVDVGGTDTYIGGAGGDNTQWGFGIDRGV